MVMSDFRPKVEIWPFHTCAVTNMQYKPYGHDASRTFAVEE